MQNSDLKKLIKVENRIMQLAEEFGLKTVPIEWDVVPDQKMLEIMAYNLPVNISNWKFGRNYEKLRTIYENVDPGLPYEVVINSNPCRAYLMKSNTFPVQCLVMSHVIGHNAFFTVNKNFVPTRKDILELMMRASERLIEYERKFGIDEVEAIVDAGHALQFHSSPLDNETEKETRLRLFEAKKREIHNPTPKSKFNDILHKKEDFKIDIELFNQNLWRAIRKGTPPEHMSDLLRYIIDNSNVLEDWHKDILEILRTEGRYFRPQIITKYMNEGFATYWHQIIMNRLFDEKILNTTEHAQYNYSNALVKAKNPLSMNPYHIGCKIWESIVDRWDKGKHGKEYDYCENKQEIKEWNKKDGNGRKKMFEIMETHSDWFFMQEFLTPQLVADLELFVYVIRKVPGEKQIVITKHMAEQIRDLIVTSFSHSQIPKINIINGNYKNRKEILLEHKHVGADLDRKYSEETLKHIYRLWQNPVYLKTKENNSDLILKCISDKSKPLPLPKTNPVTARSPAPTPVPITRP